MPSARDIKRRQKSVRNTRQVTKAIGMVAASKMRKSQLIAKQSKPYAQKALAILSHIKTRQPDIQNAFLNGYPDSPAFAKATAGKKKLLALVVTSDKGLCGSLNSAVIRESTMLFEQYKQEGYEIELAIAGVKSKSYFERMKLPILKIFKGAGDYVELEQVKPISEFIREKYQAEKFNKVITIYTEFISTLKQKVARRQILPISEDIFRELTESPSYDRVLPAALAVAQGGARGGSKGPTAPEYIFEPKAETVLDTLVPTLLDIYIYHIILESNASEHSARMVAMKNATDSAQKILDTLTLSYNKARQANITREITEITAGVNALL